MSSMLKKTGGLAFKPKALGRRGGPGSAASSQAPTAPASTSTTRTPTTEPQSAPPEEPSLTPPATLTSSQGVSSSAPIPVISSEQPVVNRSAITPAENLPPTPEPTQNSATSLPPETTIESTPRTVTRRNNQAQLSTTEPVSTAKTAASIPAAHSTTSGFAKPSVPTPASSQIIAEANQASAPPVVAATQSRSTAGSSNAPEPSGSQADGDTATTTTTTTPAPKKKRAYTRRKPRAVGEDRAQSTSGDGAVTPRRRTASQGRKRTARNDSSTATDAASGTEGESGTTPKPSKRRRRSPTPEDAVNVKVDHTAVKMGELTRDLGIGVPFKHAEAIAERAREARHRARMRKLEKDKIRMGLLPDPGEDINATRRRDGEQGGTKSRLDSSAPDGANGQAPETAGPGYIVVDGQIVINQQSLMIDNHASADDISMMRTVVEDDFTHLTTSASFMRESRVMGANSWTEEETERFYNYLEMFGTDFETISHMFPGKNRRMIKLKFNREERLRPKRINAAVMVRGGRDVNIDLDHYKEKRTDWQEADEIMKEHQALIEEHNLEVQRLKAERRAQGLADDDDDEDHAALGKNSDNAGEQGSTDISGNGDGEQADVQDSATTVDDANEHLSKGAATREPLAAASEIAAAAG